MEGEEMNEEGGKEEGPSYLEQVVTCPILDDILNAVPRERK